MMLLVSLTESRGMCEWGLVSRDFWIWSRRAATVANCAAAPPKRARSHRKQRALAVPLQTR